MGSFNNTLILLKNNKNAKEFLVDFMKNFQKLIFFSKEVGEKLFLTIKEMVKKKSLLNLKILIQIKKLLIFYALGMGWDFYLIQIPI